MVFNIFFKKHKNKHVLFVTTGNPQKTLDLPLTKMQEKNQGMFFLFSISLKI